MNTTATISWFFDQRRPKKDGTFPIKLTVYHQGEKRRYTSGFSLSAAEWGKINGARLKDASLRDLKNALDKIKQTANKIVDRAEDFNFDEFERQFLQSSNGHSNKKGLVDLYNEIINSYRKNGYEGSARAYQESLNAFLKYKKNISFQDITPSFLNSFEKNFIHKGKSITSVGIYARQLRAVFNEAINRGLIQKEQYPFIKYKIPGGYNKKKSLTNLEIKAILDFQSDSFLENQAIAFWKLSYLCNGMNIGDLLRLKKENVQANSILFNRAKTINTKKSECKTIEVILLDEIKDLLEIWGSKNAVKKDDYIFPVIDHAMTPAQQKDAIKSFNRKINQQLEKIAVRLELSGRLSNMTARHSFATKLKRDNTSAEMIGDLLGHSNLKTTQNYLGSFADETLISTAKKLLIFN